MYISFIFLSLRLEFLMIAFQSDMIQLPHIVSSPALLPAPQWTHTILPPAVRGLLWPLLDTIGYNLLALQVHNLTRALTKDPFSLQVLLA
jgi:hypothetical protein